jgi:hypothetical protein
VNPALYDAFHYEGQPPLNDHATPVVMVDNGALNEATGPGHDNLSLPAPRAPEACRIVAAYAVGKLKSFPQVDWKLPAAYAGLPRPVCIDIERVPLTESMYSEQVDDPTRRRSAIVMRAMALEMKAAAAWMGHALDVFAYAPLVPFANDAAALKASEADWRPYLDALDGAFVDVYPHKRDLKALFDRAEERVGNIARLMPGKPVVPVVTIHYGHEAPPALRYKPVPLSMFQAYVRKLLKLPATSGVCLWGGTYLSDDPADNPDGTRRIPWSVAEPYWEAARGIVGR